MALSTSLFLVGLLASSLGYALPQPPASAIQRRSAQDYVNDATSAIGQLQTWYNTSTGLWSGEWWNSANVLTMLADFDEYFPSSIDSITSTVYPNTLERAPTLYGYTGFLDDYYDDELWWCLAWIQVYDVTQNETYLDVASSIFEDAKSAWGTSPCGGLWYVQVLLNPLYCDDMSLTATLGGTKRIAESTL